MRARADRRAVDRLVRRDPARTACGSRRRRTHRAAGAVPGHRRARRRSNRIREKLASSQARAAVVASLPLAGEDVEGGDRAAIPWVIRSIVGELGVHRIIIAPDDDRQQRRRRPDPHRQGERRPGQRAAADVRGGGLRGRVRRRRRDDDAGRAPLRPVALLAAAQAQLRHRRHVDRAAVAGSGDPGDRDRDPASTRAARCSSGRSGWAATASTSGSTSSGRWSSTPRRARRSCASSTRPVTGCSRSPTTRGSPGSAASCATRRWTSCPSSSTSCAAR